MSENNNLRKENFSIPLFAVYLVVILSEFVTMAFQFENTTNITSGIRVISIILQISFCVFFAVACYYNNEYFSIFIILCFQVIFSLLLWSYYYFVVDLPLGFDANDAQVYQNALEKSFGKSYSYLRNVLQSNPRTASLSDLGYPTYRFLIYKIVPNIEGGILATVICNGFIHTVSSLYVFKIAKVFLSRKNANLVMCLWGLSATSIHVNTCGLKETIFACFVVLAIYNLIKFQSSHNILHFFGFLLNVFFIWFFRNYLSLFLLIVFFACFVFKKIFYKNFSLCLILIFLVAFFGMDILSKILPELSFVKIGRDKRLIEFFGGNGLIQNLMNFCFAWISPIPRFDSSAQIKQVIFSGFAIFKSFFSLFALYGLLKIIKQKRENFYPIITFFICNIVLVIITVNSLDFRFLHVSVFIDMILIFFGFELIKNSGFKILSCHKYSYSIFCFMNFSFILLIVLFYNLR